MQGKYKGINHLALVTNDMEKTVRFWRDLLGMRLVVTMGRKGYRQYFFELDQDNMILFFEWPGVENIPPKDHGVPVKGPFAFDHVSIGVRDLDTLWELKEKLEAAGFWVSEVIDHGFIYSVYTFDPNEIPIEFSVSVKDVDVRAHPILADRDPPRVRLEGSGPQDSFWPKPQGKLTLEERRIYPGEGRDWIYKKS